MIDEKWDLEKSARDLWSRHGLPPSHLFAMTPRELITVLGAATEDEGPVDRVAELRRHNHVVRAPKNIEPSAPDWLMPQVPRALNR